jgi:alkylation response protein AidB-like acyl-CoA dehydrogenase
MANSRANRLACEAADRAMQTYGGIGYTRHMPFEHIYRHLPPLPDHRGQRGDPAEEGGI